MSTIGLHICKQCRDIILEHDETLYTNYLSICCQSAVSGVFKIQEKLASDSRYGIKDLEYLGYVTSTESDTPDIIMVRPIGMEIDERRSWNDMLIFKVCACEEMHDE